MQALRRVYVGLEPLGRTVWLLIAVAACLGTIAALFPPVISAGILVCLGIVPLIVATGHKVFWAYLIALLFGYQFLGKGIAYAGVAPLYIGEIGLGLGVLSGLAIGAFSTFRVMRRWLRPELVLLLGFMGWQLLQTLPYLPAYGVEALRDATLWGYALYALAIYLLVPASSIRHAAGLYARILPWFLIWSLLAFAISRAHLLTVYFPGAPVPLIYVKAGDVCVHLAGAAGFILLRLDRNGSRWNARLPWLLWLLWGVSFLFNGLSRGGMVSILAGLAVIVLLRPRTRWDRPLAIALLTLSMLSIADVRVEIPNAKREMSVQQIIDNFESVLGLETDSNLEASRQWRLRWWSEIVDYTFRGRYFWFGKGYGINLATDDGFQVDAAQSLRSPHNVFMTILARSGVPGLALWLTFLLAFGWMLASKARQMEATGRSWDADFALWLLAYWIAALVNGTFDVFLEGPMGGIWFWSLTGLGLAYFSKPVTREQHQAALGGRQCES